MPWQRVLRAPELLMPKFASKSRCGSELMSKTRSGASTWPKCGDGAHGKLGERREETV